MMIQMKNEKQGAAEWLRGIVGECEPEESDCKAMVKLFGIDCKHEKTCRDCLTKMMTTIADRIDAERALPDGIEWPRFEDGELVKIGDEVEYKGETMRVYLATIDADGWALWCSREGIDGRLSGSYGERVKRPSPKVLGADGAPIKVGDVVYFVADKDESALIVECIDVSGEKPVADLVYSDERGTWHLVDPEKLTHERPDSWERIEEDAAKPVCEYAGAQKSTADPDRYSCIDCLYDDLGFHTDAECNERMRLDLARRAKALAKAGEGL